MNMKCKHYFIEHTMNHENRNVYSVNGNGCDLLFKSNHISFSVLISIWFEETNIMHFSSSYQLEDFTDGDIVCNTCNQIFMTTTQLGDIGFLYKLKNHNALLNYLLGIGFELTNCEFSDRDSWGYRYDEDFDSNPFIEYLLDLDEEYEDLYDDHVK